MLFCPAPKVIGMPWRTSEGDLIPARGLTAACSGAVSGVYYKSASASFACDRGLDLLPLFAITLFISAALLFLVQPMIGKMLLPYLGGTPAVWNTCMVFFQAALLGGYAYAHALTRRLGIRRQLVLHAGLLVLPLVPLALWQLDARRLAQDWLPTDYANPIPWLLAMLALAVGLPFLVL